MPRDINLGPTGGPFVTLQENNGDLDISNATSVDLHGATLTNANVGGFDSVDVFEADGTFDASNVDTVFVECVGGGGGAGGFEATTQTVGSAAGGGGGGYAAAYKDVSTANSISVTVGAGGAGGTGPQDGTSGGDSTFQTSTQVIGNGGGGGEQSPAPGSSKQGLGGGGQGDFVISGGDGEWGESTDTSTSQDIIAFSSAAGGDSVYGNGGISIHNVGGGIDGVNGQKYGGGGSSAVYAVGGVLSNDLDGGAGADGVVIVYYKA